MIADYSADIKIAFENANVTNDNRRQIRVNRGKNCEF